MLRWKEQAFPNPYVHLINYLAGVEGAVEATLRSLVLIVSGLLSYRIAKVVWAAGLSDIHVGRADAVDACSVPWADVPTSTAAASEFLGTLFLNIVPGLAFDNPYLANNDPKYTAALVSAVVLGTVLAALGFSGTKI